MFTGHNSTFWDNRYSEADYAYGIKPNQFLSTQQHHLKPGMKVLVPGDGEGRNSVWLARQGLDVLAVDFSSVGLRKTEALAQANNVTIQTECADLTTWNWSFGEYDLVVSIFLHFAPNVRVRMHQAMLAATKPGGLIILEAFTPEQIDYQAKYNSGGPPIVDMLYSAEILREDFRDAKVIELEETETQLCEGRYHSGIAALIRGVFQNIKVA